MIIAGRAKLNIYLRVGRRRADGLHPIRSLMQHITWADHFEVDDSEDDVFTVVGDAPNDTSNLAWRGFIAGRGDNSTRQPARVTLRKAIPRAAGLGGGSADAAAGLVAGACRAGRDLAGLAATASKLGSDVPFCLEGGTALVTGVGDEVTPLPFSGGYAVAAVVPPTLLATTDVYASWDTLGEPQDTSVDTRLLPPALRSEQIGNDLWPAACRLAPELADWRRDLQARWGRPVLMSGSGPTLYGCFLDLEEAGSAADGIETARAVHPAVPAQRGWVQVER